MPNKSEENSVLRGRWAHGIKIKIYIHLYIIKYISVHYYSVNITSPILSTLGGIKFPAPIHVGWALVNETLTKVTVFQFPASALKSIKYFYPLLLTLPAFTRKPLLPQSGPLKGMQRSDPNAAYSLEQPPQPNHRPICKKWMLIFIAHWIFVVACYTARGDRYIYTWICVHIVHVPIVQDTYLWVRHGDTVVRILKVYFHI